MKCACPWCDDEVEEGYLSVMGQRTCYEHSAEALFETLANAWPNKPLAETTNNKEEHE